MHACQADDLSLQPGKGKDLDARGIQKCGYNLDTHCSCVVVFPPSHLCLPFYFYSVKDSELLFYLSFTLKGHNNVYKGEKAGPSAGEMPMCIRGSPVPGNVIDNRSEVGGSIKLYCLQTLMVSLQDSLHPVTVGVVNVAVL